MNFELIELFAGYGLLTEALTAGLSKVGEVQIVAGSELEPRYLKLWSARHPASSTFCGSVGDFHPAELSVPKKAKRILVCGIPCTGASGAGKSKLHLSAAEEHKDVGHLFLYVAHYIRLHGKTLDGVVFENVPPYARSLSARLLRGALKECGFEIFEKVVNPFTDFETPTQRERWILVASKGLKFNWLYEPKAFKGTMGQFLDAPSALDDAESATPEQVAADSKFLNRKAAEGCGFRMRILTPDSEKCPTVCKTYGKRQPSATFIKTSSSYRMIRPRELARISGFPESFPLPEARTTAYEVLGQGVVFNPFFELGKALGGYLSGTAAASPKRAVVEQLELAM